MEQDLSAQVAARAEASGISPRTAYLLITGSLPVERCVTRPPTDEEVQARMAVANIHERTARLLIGQVIV